MSSDLLVDEIDLIELIGSLWDAKWLVAAITTAFAGISISGALLMPSSFTGKIRISALNNQQMAAYQTLNDTPAISHPIYADGTLIGQTGVISKEELFTNFVDRMRGGASFAEAHRRFDPEFKNFEGTSTELTQKIAQISNSYAFKLDEGSNNSGLLSFETVDRELSRTIVKAALDDIRETSRAESLAFISSIRNSIKTSITFELENIDIQIRNALSKHENSTAAHLALLKEHAAIARQLENADGQTITSGNSGVNVAVEQKQPLYNRGYKALEKEIALIEARGKGEAAFPYVPDYVSLAAQKLALTSDTRLARIDASIAASPIINKDEFRAINYDLDTLVFEATTSKRLIVILATLMGSLIAVIFVLLRNALAARRHQ